VKKVLIVLFLLLDLSLSATTYYVSTKGNDTYPGTIAQPFATWQKGFQTAVAGDIVYIRGGVYYTSGASRSSGYVGVFLQNKHGSSGNMINIWAYPGETPVLDCSNITQSGVSHIGISLEICSYFYLKGLQIRNVHAAAGSYAYGFICYQSTHCKFELLTVSSNDGPGFAISGDDNLFLNCDSYENYDDQQGGESADGFITWQNDDRTSNTLTGCRSWKNSDDGFDTFGNEGTVIFKSCWSFENGYGSSGDGAGFKLGSTHLTQLDSPQRVLTNCLSFNNKGVGYDQSEGNILIDLFNNTSYYNSRGFSFANGGNLAIEFKNNISYYNKDYADIFQSNMMFDHNSWQNGHVVSQADFTSLDASSAYGSRKTDGNLPDITFLHLATGSDLIDAGIDVGLSFSGNAPDLGAFETVSVSAPPATPLYISSAIENSTPSVIEMTYNLTLANTVPATSAFSVQVNSVARTITSVTVSGTKVLLTLGSPVAYGNVVTVSYTVPSSNPLQTASGGKADAITGKSVTNKINPPPSPVYVSSVIENAAPSLIEMTYNLSLANIVPAASAFSVSVNSAARNVSSVAVSGTKVLLTLASPVVYGNSVTVAYTKPSANPLQTSSGGQAATISAHTVTNKVNAVSQPVVVATPPAIVNIPPVVVVNNISGTYSGFIGKINASGSYDTNKDNLTYAWKVPGNIPVSATNSPVIEFLAPIVDANQTYEFTLTVSDGKSPQTKTVPVTIIPYEPGLEKAEVISVEAASFQSPYYPYNILDGNIGTMWSVNGNDQWIILELNGTYSIQHIKLSFQPGQKKEFYFDIFGSNDKENWEPVLSKSRSCSFSGNLQVFDFPASKTEREFRYVKLIGQGNSVDKWNYISEFRIFGYRHKNPADYEEQIVKIYPNPAHELINILIDESTFVPDFIKIISLTGKVIFNGKINLGTRQLQIPIDFKRGIYVVQMGTGDLTVFTQKIIVTD
jgi:uncharacterized repeat protein (TIGR02059 family)